MHVIVKIHLALVSIVLSRDDLTRVKLISSLKQQNRSKVELRLADELSNRETAVMVMTSILYKPFSMQCSIKLSLVSRLICR